MPFLYIHSNHGRMSIYYEDLDELLAGLRVIATDTDIQANVLCITHLK